MSDLGIRFRLRTLLLATLLVCMAAAVATALPLPGIFALMGLSISFPAILVVFLVYGTRYQRAFAIGALFPAVGAVLAWLVLYFPELISDLDVRLDGLLRSQAHIWMFARFATICVGAWTYSIVCGLVCYLALLFIERDPVG